MLIPLQRLINQFNVTLEGVLHVGAHECEELKDYENYIDRSKIIWIEAIPEKVEYCIQKFPNIIIENAVVSDIVENVTFNISNNGQSSSFLNFGLHSKYHPHIYYIKQFQTQTSLLKDILPQYDHIKFNFINLDIQGVELRALKGMKEYLQQHEHVKYIYTEVNDDFVYENCNLVSELDEFLKEFNFVRVLTEWTNCKWGDAFYIRMSKL
jgi:FkbM family methyltransferase